MTKKDKKQPVFQPLTDLSSDNGMVCGPDGCSLADHFDWAKKDKEDKKLSK